MKGIKIGGEGILRRKGVAASCFTAVAEQSVNIGMSSFGSSEVALFFIFTHKDLQKAVEAIHSTFFSDEL